MKMICPECGLKGTADDTLLGKKVRCPECQQVFRVDDSVIVGDSTVSTAVSGVPVEETATVQPSADASPALPEGVKVCKKCGFAFSEQFVTGSETEPVCAVCSA